MIKNHVVLERSLEIDNLQIFKREINTSMTGKQQQQQTTTSVPHNVT